MQLAKGFTKFEVSHIPREENATIDLLAQLATTNGHGLNKMVIHETLEAPSTKTEEAVILENSRGWMTPIIQYLTQEKLPDEKIKA